MKSLHFVCEYQWLLQKHSLLHTIIVVIKIPQVVNQTILYLFVDVILECYEKSIQRWLKLLRGYTKISHLEV